MADSTPALARATEALYPYWAERYPSGPQADAMAQDAVSAALHDPDDPDALAQMLAEADGWTWAVLDDRLVERYRRQADALRPAILGGA